MPDPNPRLVIEFDPAQGAFSHQIIGSMPVMPLLGMLEYVKAQLVAQQMQAALKEKILEQARGKSTRVLLADGTPAPNSF